MAKMEIKNRRTKVSPGGVITLPVAARKALQMKPGESGRVVVAVNGDGVQLAPAKEDGFRVSAGGQMELRGEARRLLETNNNRHFWFELDDENQQVTLYSC